MGRWQKVVATYSKWKVGGFCPVDRYSDLICIRTDPRRLYRTPTFIDTLTVRYAVRRYLSPTITGSIAALSTRGCSGRQRLCASYLRLYCCCLHSDTAIQSARLQTPNRGQFDRSAQTAGPVRFQESPQFTDSKPIKKSNISEVLSHYMIVIIQFCV